MGPNIPCGMRWISITKKTLRNTLRTLCPISSGQYYVPRATCQMHVHAKPTLDLVVLPNAAPGPTKNFTAQFPYHVQAVGEYSKSHHPFGLTKAQPNREAQAVFEKSSETSSITPPLLVMTQGTTYHGTRVVIHCLRGLNDDSNLENIKTVHVHKTPNYV